MKRFLTSAIVLGCSLLVINCKKNDDNGKETVIRDRQEVFNDNIQKIEEFLKTNKMEVLEEGVTFETVANEASNSIWKQTEYELKSITLKNDTYNLSQKTGKYEKEVDNVEYKVYYLIINEGGGEKPYKHDNVFTSYAGYNLDKTSFDTFPFGFWSSYPSLGAATEIISGYRQILQQINTASGVIDNGDGTYTYENPGRVVVFIPSGLAYFNTSRTNISGYAPLIFDIKSIALKEVDHDNDGILDKYEDVNNNGNLWDDDTDGDGKPNFLDLDDDGDGYTTKEEITYTTQENGETVKKIYPFDEIPNCQGGSVKKHLDKNCH